MLSAQACSIRSARRRQPSTYSTRLSVLLVRSLSSSLGYPIYSTTTGAGQAVSSFGDARRAGRARAPKSDSQSFEIRRSLCAYERLRRSRCRCLTAVPAGARRWSYVMDKCRRVACIQVVPHLEDLAESQRKLGIQVESYQRYFTARQLRRDLGSKVPMDVMLSGVFSNSSSATGK